MGNGPTNAKERQKQLQELLEGEPKKKKKGLEIQDLEKQAAKVEADPNVKAAESIAALRGNKEVMKQRDGIANMSNALGRVLARLAKKGVDLKKIRNPQDLQREVVKNNIALNLPEAAAVERLDRILAQSGPTSTHFKEAWPNMIKTAEEAAEGYTGFYLRHLKKDAVGTLAVTALGLLGVYTGYQGLKFAGKKAIGYKDKESADDKSFFNKKIWVPVMLGAASVFLGKDRLMKMMLDAGLDPFDMKGKIEKGQEFTKEQKDKIKKATPELQKKIGEMQDKAAKKTGKKTEKPEVEAGAAADATAGIVAAGAGGFGIGKTIDQSKPETAQPEVAFGSTLEGKPGSIEASEAAIEEMEGKTSEVTKTGEELIKENRYPGAKRLFLTFYFNPRYYDIAHVNEAIDNISQMKFSEIKKLQKKYDGKEEIPRSELPKLTSEISPKVLALLINNLIKFSQLGNLDKQTPDPTVQQIFENVWDNPMADQFEDVTKRVTEAIKDGDISDAVAAIAMQGVELAKDKATEMAMRLDEVLGIKADELNDDEKLVYRHIQTQLMINPTLIDKDPKEAVNNLLVTNPDLAKYPKGVDLGVEFFTKIKERTPALLDRAYEKFEIKGDPNYLRQGVNMKNLKFFNACELVLLTTAMEGAGDESTDLMILTVLLKSFSAPYLRDPYIGQLSDELTKDAPHIKIPGLKNIKPYISRALRIAGASLGYKALDFFNRMKPYQTAHPTAKDSDEMVAAFTEGDALVTFGSFAKEAGGTGLELTSDALAAIVLAWPGLHKELASCDTGKEFLDLIRLNGGHVGAYKDRDGAMGIMIDTGKEVLLARPGTIVWESVKSAAKFELGDAALIWVGGSSFWVTAGMIKGVFKTHHTPEGKILYALRTRALNAFKYGLRGLKYPYKAPLMVADFAMQGVRAAARTGEGMAGIGRGISDTGRRSYNWTRDVMRYGLPGQNVENMIITHERLKHHRELGKNALENRMLESTIDDADNPFKKAGKRAKVKGKVALRTVKGLATEPITEVRRWLTGDYHLRMAQKYAGRIANQMNHLYQLPPDVELPTENIYKAEFKRVIEAADRFERFREQLRADPGIVDEIKAISKAKKGSDGAKEIQRLLQSRMGLESAEAEALGRRLNKPKEAKKVFEQLQRGLEYEDKLKAAKAKLPKSPKADTPEAAKAAATADEALKAAKSELKALEESLEAAKKAGDPVDLGKVRRHQELVDEIARLEQGPAVAAQNLDEAIKAAQAELKTIQDSIAAAKKAGQVESMADHRAVKALKEAIEDMRKLQEVQEAQRTATVAADAGGSTVTAIPTKEVLQAEEAVAESTAAATKAVQGTGRFSKLAKGIRVGGRVLGGAGMGAGAAFGYFEAGASIYEAATTNRDGRAKVQLMEAALWGTDAAINTGAALAFFNVSFGSTTVASASSVAGSIAIPLAPIAIAGGSALSAYNEETRTAEEFAQMYGGNSDLLISQFYTTANAASVGDAFLAGFRAAGPSSLIFGLPLLARAATGDYGKDVDKEVVKGRAKKEKNMHKIFRALIACQRDYELLKYIAEEPSSNEKNDKIEEKIAANYSKYHEYFFRQGVPSTISTFGTARRFVADAEIFHEIMTKRDEAVAAGREFTIGKFNLHKDRYDIEGGVDNPKAKVIYMPDQVVKAYKEEALALIKPGVKENLEKMDTAVLVRIFVQLNKAFHNEANKEYFEKNPTEKVRMFNYMTLLRNYLRLSRDIDFNKAIANPVYHEPQMSLVELKTHMSGMLPQHSEFYQELDLKAESFERTPAVHALYKLAEYFGYSGEHSEDGLKQFFASGKENSLGIYWDADDKEWMINEAGMEFDNSMGPELTTAIIHKMIKNLREFADDTLEHRNEEWTNFTHSTFDYEAEVLKMAGILEAGLKAGETRGYKRSKAEAKLDHDEDFVAPPRVFNPKKLDYTIGKELLMYDYEKVIQYTIDQTAWNQLKYKVDSVDQITLTRGDGDAEVTLYRTNDTWSVGTIKEGLSLVQAVALGNLKNWTEQWLEDIKKKHGDTAGSDRPFEIDGKTIDFDVSGTFIDRDFIKHWAPFYKKIGLSKKNVVDFLNDRFGR